MTNKVDFDDYTENYNDLIGEGTGFFSSDNEYLAKYKVEIVRQRIRSKVLNVLEYGCGIGRNIPYIQEAFPDAKIQGSDISDASLDIARQNNINSEFYNELKKPNNSETFDLIFVPPAFSVLSPLESYMGRLPLGGQYYVHDIRSA